jgi:hypothetical protein
MLNKIVKKKISTYLSKKKTTINVMPQSKKIISNLSTIINILTKINIMSTNEKRTQFGLTKKILRIKKNVLLFTKNKILRKVSTK